MLIHHALLHCSVEILRIDQQLYILRFTLRFIIIKYQLDEVIKRIKYKNNDFLYLFSVEMEVYLKSGFRFRKSRLCDILTSFDLSSW